jgi:hypothetical protein
MFEIKFGPYIPHLDSSASVRDRPEPTDLSPGLPSPTPFSDYFGGSQGRPALAQADR